FGERQPITDAQIELGSQVWQAFCADDPAHLSPFAATTSPELPFLTAALRRFLEEYPSAANGLSRTERQIGAVLSNGPLSMRDAFRASTELEDPIFMGDLSFFNIVEGLAAAKKPLVAVDEDSDDPVRLADASISLTDTGRDVLAGRADHITLNG